MSSTETAAAASSGEDPVKKALESGEWKAKKDPKSGRTFYVHVQTRRSTWNLAKELAKIASESSGKKTIDGLQAEEIAAAEERAKINREERQQKMQARAQAEMKLREEIDRIEQNNQVLELEISNLRGPVRSEAAQVEELKRILADHEVSLQDVESELTEKRDQKSNDLLKLQNRIAILEAQLESEDQFHASVQQRYNQMSAERMELKSDLSREESVSLSLQAQIRETETKTQQLRAKLHLQRSDVAAEEEAIKLIEDDVRGLSLAKSKLESEITRKQKELESAKRRKADEERTSQKVTDIKSTQSAIANLEHVLAARERELAQLMEADSLLEKNGAFERANTNLRSVLRASIRDEEALKQLCGILESENQKLAEAVAVARDEKQRLETMKRQFRLRFTTNDPQGEFTAMCAKWSSILNEYTSVL